MDDQRAKRIQSLLSHPAWPELEAEIDLARDRWLKTVTAKVAAGIITDQRELDYMRGRFDGAKMIIRQPARAIKVLDEIRERETVE